MWFLRIEASRRAGKHSQNPLSNCYRSFLQKTINSAFFAFFYKRKGNFSPPNVELYNCMHIHPVVGSCCCCCCSGRPLIHPLDPIHIHFRFCTSNSRNYENGPNGFGTGRLIALLMNVEEVRKRGMNEWLTQMNGWTNGRLANWKEQAKMNEKKWMCEFDGVAD